jgi:hypothetical protein
MRKTSLDQQMKFAMRLLTIALPYLALTALGCSRSPALQESAMRLTSARVLGTTQRTSATLVTLRTNSEVVVTTPEHPFARIGGGWTPASTLKVGDLIQGPTGLTPIVGVTAQPVPPTTVYNLTIAKTHSYFVGQNALLVHNGNCVGRGTSARAGARLDAARAQHRAAIVRRRQIEATGSPTEALTNRTEEWPYHHPPERYELRPGEPVPRLDPSKGRHVWQVNADGTVVIAPEVQAGFGVTDQRPGGRWVKHGDLNPGPNGQSRGVARAGGELIPVQGADGNWTWIMDNESSFSLNRADGAVSTPENLKAAKQLMEESGLDTSGFTLEDYNGDPVPAN